MARIKDPGKGHQGSAYLKEAGVELVHYPGTQVKGVAAELDTHLFMLSRRRKEVRGGKLEKAMKKPIYTKTAAELKRLKQPDRDLARRK